MVDASEPRKKIYFVTNDAAFFLRHFAPALVAAEKLNFRIAVVAPVVTDAIKARRSGIDFILSPLERNVPSPWRVIYQVMWMVSVLRKGRPDIVAAFSNRPLLVILLASPFTRVPKNILYVTGLGLIDLLPDLRSRFARMLLYGVMRVGGRSARCHFVFENASDMKRIGLKPNDRREIFPGAGVDPVEFAPLTLPATETLRIAVISRLIWSKGVDIAAQAVYELVRESLPVELNIYGATDEANPLPVRASEFAGMPGVVCHGFAEDLTEVWRQNHIAIFPSRGGEGLPRALLEAAACARPAIVSDVAGCADFIRDGREGYVVRPDSVSELKAAITRFIERPSDIDTFGKAARSRVIEFSTTAILERRFSELFIDH